MIIRHKDKITQRKTRVRQKIRSRSNLPRLSVFRSNRDFFAQVIDDTKGKTLISAGKKDLAKSSGSGKKKTPPTKIDLARLLGEAIAKKALKAKITKVVFDRGSYKYHGRVKAFADSARKHGLTF